jgi:hypothetical protein
LVIRGRLRAWRRRRCKHSDTITVRTAGMERMVCEACGNVSFEALSGSVDQPSRSSFARAYENDGKHAAQDFGLAEEVRHPR